MSTRRTRKRPAHATPRMNGQKPTAKKSANGRKKAQKPAVTTAKPKPIVMRKLIFHVIIVIAIAFIPLWLLTPYINIISGQHSYSLSSYSITATYENSTDVTSLIGTSDGNVLSLESSRVAYPFTYDATFSFTDEPAGNHSVSGWETITGFDEPRVLGIVANHAKVINASGSRLSRSVQVFSTGAIEFWLYINPTEPISTFVELSSGGLDVAILKTVTVGPYRRLWLSTSSQNYTLQDDVLTSSWYRISIQLFNGIGSIIVNDVLAETNVPISSVDKMIVSDGCFDAIGCSSDGYKVGDNILPLKQFLLRAEFKFSLNLISFIESASSVIVSIECPSIIGGSLYSMMYIGHDSEMYKMMDISDDITMDGTRIQFTVEQYKYFLIRSGLSILMIQSGDTITSMGIDHLSILVNVMI